MRAYLCLAEGGGKLVLRNLHLHLSKQEKQNTHTTARVRGNETIRHDTPKKAQNENTNVLGGGFLDEVTKNDLFFTMFSLGFGISPLSGFRK